MTRHEECQEPIHGLDICGMPVETVREYTLYDDQEMPVFYRRVRCALGHSYDEEVDTWP